MLDEKLYHQLEKEFSAHKIEEMVEDVLLELSELIADRQVMDQDVIQKVKYGKTVVEACGSCAEEDGEVSVLIRWIRIGSTQLEINDYFL